MGFEDAVKNTADIKSCFKKGLRGLGSNSTKVNPKNTRNVDGSVDIDTCTDKKYPNDQRWDYVLSYLEKSYYVEVHPASSSKNVDEMIKKEKWLKSWLKSEAPELNSIYKEFHWISTNKVSFNRSSPESRKLAKSGILFPKRILNLE